MANKFKADINTVVKKLGILESELVSRKTFQSLARTARGILFKRVKSGKGAEGGTSTKLAKLEPTTIDVRRGKGIMRTFKTSAGRKTVFIPGVDGRPESTGTFFSPGRSNLTFSGQLLDSIDFTVKSPFGFRLFIPNSKRRPYKNNDVFNKKDPPTNAELAVYLQAGRNTPTKSKPRPFFELTKGEQRIIIREYNNIIKQIIRRNKL